MLKKILAILVMFYAALAMAAVDVNKATDAELDGIKGIGPAISKQIVAERKKGDFKNWQDFIERIKGVGEKNSVKLSEAGLTVNGQSFKGAAMKTETTADKKADKMESRAAARDEKKDGKATTSAAVEKKETKAEMKAEKKADRKAAKEARAEAKAEAKAEKKEAKADAARPAASAAKSAASTSKK